MKPVDRADFEESCAYELCEMGTKDEDAICSFAEAVATRCSELEMPVKNWRKKDFCGTHYVAPFIWTILSLI